MDPIATSLSIGGFCLTQLKRHGMVAIYEQSKGGRTYSWEVVMIRILPAATFPGGKSYPERESYPANEDWGTLAWTCTTLEQAEERFNNLVKEQQ